MSRRLRRSLQYWGVCVIMWKDFFSAELLLWGGLPVKSVQALLIELYTTTSLLLLRVA